ncbi:MAG: sigma-54-dependent Fis family transcriptional regulator [Deltaproteobacteria bacterium]|nr:sigma-54-dependent Fis family transcriptional regulator [Deltaproteobacteria bacterium]MBW2070766.1 sigma-54-dependent Fis family transcriptional regulator [Deltaproteobacteria bacterium]
MTAKILLVDDELDMLSLLKRLIASEFACDIDTAASGVQALELLARSTYDLALVDVRMPGMDGIELLERIRETNPWTTVLMLTAYGVVELAVESIKKGAYDFITKPFDQDKLIHVLRNAMERSRLLRENLNLQRRIKESEPFQDLVGASPAMQRIYQTIQMIAKTDVTVLLTGESGTGKDLAARAIHRLSHRSSKPYVAVNCPTLPENILESELFGYRKGAFTDASADKTGLFEDAQGGTIYLDEIGDIAPTIQTKLLRVLQEKEIKPLGQNKSITVDVRVIASTNRNLREKIQQKQFREDLFFRLNVLTLEMPPLRERKEDIPLLAEHFLQRYCAEFNKPGKSLSPEFIELLLRRPWEGNVRELENIIKRAILLSADELIQPEDINWTSLRPQECLVGMEIHDLPYKEAKKELLQRFHIEYLSRLLSRHKGNVTRSAKEIGMERQALQQIMRRYGVKSQDFRN